MTASLGRGRLSQPMTDNAHADDPKCTPGVCTECGNWAWPGETHCSFLCFHQAMIRKVAKDYQEAVLEAVSRKLCEVTP